MNAQSSWEISKVFSSGEKLEQGTHVTAPATSTQHFRIIWWKVTREHPAKAVAQHPWGATLGALDLIADVRFSGTLMWFCFFSLSLEPWCRYQDLFFFIIIVIIFTGSEGCLAHNAAKPSVCYFCCFMMWPSCYVTRDMGVLLRPSQGTGVTVRDQGRGLMSTFYIQGGEPQACCHVVLHALPLSHRNSPAHSLTRVLAHRHCGGK